MGEEEPYLHQLIRAVSLNPLRAKLVRDLDGLDRFPWTGHAVVMGRRESEPRDVEAVFRRFGAKV